MEDVEYKKQMEEVKKNCPFCKIIKGEIPSKRVYEDDKVLAILDINPHRKGHTLVVLKEHYPILPLVPKEDFVHLFKIVRQLSPAIAKGTVNQFSNVFIANGAVAGQQSNHFMLHIMPNESTGGFDIPEGKVDQGKLEEVGNILANNLPIMMSNHFKRNPDLKPKQEEKELEQKSEDLPNAEKNHVEKQLDNPSIFNDLSVEQIAETLMANKEAFNMLLDNTEKFKEMVPSHPQLSNLFSKVSVDEVIEYMKNKSKKAEENIDDMSFDDVVNFIMGNDLLRDSMLQDISKFKELIPQNESLQKLFSKASPDEVLARIRARM